MQYKDMSPIVIDRRSAVSIDEQIKESIKSLILDQTYYYQTVLPTSIDLSRHLNVEEKQVLSAYKKLLNERYIKLNEHKRYEVAYFELTNRFFYRNLTIYDAIIQMGMEPKIKCLEKKIVTLSETENISMGFDKKEKLLYINRIYMGDEQPIIILENYLPLSIFPEIDQKLKGHEALNAFINQNYNLFAKVSKRITKAVNLNAKTAEILGERKNAASIQSTNHVYDQYGRLIDYGRSFSISSYYFQSSIEREELLKDI
jgi:GntR family transcriptional regulator